MWRHMVAQSATKDGTTEPYFFQGIYPYLYTYPNPYPYLYTIPISLSNLNIYF